MLEEVRSRHFCSPNSSFSADIKKRAGATEEQCEFSVPTLVAWERNVAKLSPAALRPGYPPLSVFWARRSRFSRGGQLSHSASPPRKMQLRVTRWRFIAFPSVSNDRFPYGCEIIFCNDFRVRRSAEKAAAADRFFFALPSAPLPPAPVSHQCLFTGTLFLVSR